MNTRKLIALLILVSTSSCEINRYQSISIEQTDLPNQDIKEELSEWKIFTQVLIQVESEGRSDAVGKTQDVGILQITPIYVKDVNRILGEDKYSLSCRTDIDKSLEMFEILQSYYNPSKSIDKAIKLHNPRAGQGYKEKIMKQMKLIKTNLS